MKVIAIQDFYFLSVIALIKIVSWLSFNGPKKCVVHSVAYSAFLLSRRKRRLGQANLTKACGGKMTPSQIRRTLRRSFYEFWSDTFAMLPSKTEQSEIKQAELQGGEHLHRALEKGKGAILWVSNYFGPMVATKQILHENGFAVHKVHVEKHLGGFNYKGSPTWVQHKIIRPFFERCEKPFIAGILYLPNSDSLAFTRAFRERLTANGIICAAGDGKSGRKFVPVNLLGFTERFATGMASLARLSGAPILPVFCVQEGKGKRTLIIERPVYLKGKEDREHELKNSLNHYASLLEGYINRYPQLYRNWHMLGESSVSQAF